jgi:hypothetical protein
MGKIAFLFFGIIIIVGLCFSDDYDEVWELLIAERGGDIQYLSRINLGISGGDNWVANRKPYTYIYTVDSEKKVKHITTTAISELTEVKYRNVDLEYDILQYIPGTQLGSKAAKFGDYNGDGIDEIFIINPYNESHCYILEYDNDKGEKVFPYSARYDLSSSKGPAPFGFYNHLGRDGIMTHLWDYPQERYVWIFLVWDEASRKYITLARMGEDEVNYSMFKRFDESEGRDYQIDGEPPTWEDNQNTNETAIIETVPVTPEGGQPVKSSAKSGKSTFIIAFIVGAVAVGSAVILLAVWKRKKR